MNKTAASIEATSVSMKFQFSAAAATEEETAKPYINDTSSKELTLDVPVYIQ